MRLLEPRSRRGVVVRVLFFVAVISLANILFATLIGPLLPGKPVLYQIAKSAFVGGPLLWFFFVVMLYQVRLQRHLSLLSRKDWLTGLNNRRTFLDLASKRHKDYKSDILLMLDADNFKQINDTYGHQAGDTCLKAIAYMLKRNLREEDVSGRIGGEEFAILLANSTPDQARVIAERLIKPIPFRAGPAHLTVTLSIGAVVTSPDRPLEQLFSLADKALYQAKSEGRARVIFAGPELGTPRMPIAV
ncbi:MULTISPECIES: GGDEF domain-containing protein [unclassified Yoonia]|uniref:GGDEF domain-containing protein n=1 Tax=unclassified Yoonia TaxID=2629118 RepID=UPI002AFFEA2C|nr:MULTISPECIES: GGDEF domain-containing protein [unclassified Yoonia]